MLDSAHRRLVTIIAIFARAKEREASCPDSEFPNSQSKKNEKAWVASFNCMSKVGQ